MIKFSAQSFCMVGTLLTQIQAATHFSEIPNKEHFNQICSGLNLIAGECKIVSLIQSERAALRLISEVPIPLTPTLAFRAKLESLQELIRGEMEEELLFHVNPVVAIG